MKSILMIFKNFNKITIKLSSLPLQSDHQALQKFHNLAKKVSIHHKLDQQQNTKNNSINNSGNKMINKLRKNHENTDQKVKKNIYNSTKQAIFNKLLQKNQNSTKAQKNINNKENHNQKQKILLPSQNFYHKHQNIQKLAKLYQEKQQKELQQCTFNPKIISQKSQRIYGIKEFYNNQISHTHKTQDKIQQMREMIKLQKEKENTFQPKLTKETIELTQRRSNNNVYQRLYHKKNQIQDPVYTDQRQCISFRRATSKKYLTFVSSSKKKVQNTKSKQKIQDNFAQYENELISGNNKHLKSQRSLKKFHQIFQKKQNNHNITGLIANKQEKSPKIFNRKNSQNLYKGFSEKSSNKKQSVDYGHQKLDCQALFQQKRQSKNALFRENSYKLIPSSSTRRIQTSKSKYQNQQWVKSADGVHLKNKTSEKNIKIALQKFVKQLFFIASKNQIKSMIDFNQMIEFLKDMNFIQNIEQFCESPSDSQIKVKIFQIWTMLEGTQSGFIIFQNLLKILCAIQGFTNTSMIEETFKNVGQIMDFNQFFQSNKTKSLVLSEKDAKTIKKDFMSLYLIRFRLGQSKSFARGTKIEQFPFHPSISKESQQYAEKYREKIIEESQKLLEQGLIDFDVPEDGLIDHSNLLILDQKIKDYKMEQKRLQSERQKIKKENESMHSHSVSHRSINDTFAQKHKRSLNKGDEEMDSNLFSRISHNQSQSRSKDHIFQELYQQGRRSKSNRRDKSSQQVQFESNKNELTFKPKINRGKVVSEFKEDGVLHQNIPNFTKQVMRMRSNKNYHKEQLSVSPLLYLNITIQGNSQTKIPVFQTDTFQQIVEKVRIIMKIQDGPEQKNKLKSLLQEQIIPVLDQLGIYEKQGRFFTGK